MFKGIPASPGIGFGQAFIMNSKNQEIPNYKISNVQEELIRLNQALETAKGQISELKSAVVGKIGADKSQVFEAHILIL